VQAAKSEGLVPSSLYSNDGGFGCVSDGSASFDEVSANAYRADLSGRFDDLFDAIPGRITLYTQTLDEGYSAPGLKTLTDTKHHGGTLRMQVTDGLQVSAKADRKKQAQGYSVNAQELNVGYQLNDRWNVS